MFSGDTSYTPAVNVKEAPKLLRFSQRGVPAYLSRQEKT